VRLTPFRKVLLALFLVAVLALSAATVLSLPRSYLLMATTTSTRDTGLLDFLLPQFTAATGIEVRYTAVGTGQALALGRSGDVDVVMVHSPTQEAQFMADGEGVCRVQIMYNRFVVVGPLSDPAGVANATNATDAFLRIYQNRTLPGFLFESRADNSGTNTKELQLWTSAGLNASAFSASSDPWYQRTAQGMANTLTIANNQDAYTLSDDGTWYAQMGHLPYLKVVYSRPDSILRNQYSVIPVNPANHRSILADQALVFARWLMSPRGLDLIGNYTVNGHRIFTLDPAGAC
jgi:tungstate transport system substrate-binding protein